MTSPIQSIEDVRTRTSTAVGSSGPSSTDSIYPNVLNYLFGMKFKVIVGYASAPEMSMAIERGELDGRCGLTWSSLQSVNADWIKFKKVRVILQIALGKASRPRGRAVRLRPRAHRGGAADPDALGRAERHGTALFHRARDRAGARSRFCGAHSTERSGTPPMSRTQQKIGVGADPMRGEEVESLVRRVYATPKNVVEKAGIAAKGK